MKIKKILFYMLAGILGGCLPVMSVHPLYTDKDVVFEEKLLGTWVDDANDPKTTWEFSQPNEKEKKYRLIFKDDEGKKGAFDAYLTKLGNKFFLDVFPAESPWDEEDPNKVDWVYNTLFLVPVHSFIKIDFFEAKLQMGLTYDEKMGKLLEENPNSVEHTSINERFVLTAPTEKLQAFVLKYVDDERLFTDEGILVRQNLTDSNEVSNR